MRVGALHWEVSVRVSSLEVPEALLACEQTSMAPVPGSAGAPACLEPQQEDLQELDGQADEQHCQRKARVSPVQLHHRHLPPSDQWVQGCAKRLLLIG